MIYKVILKTMWIEATTVVYNIQNFISTPYGDILGVFFILKLDAFNLWIYM